MQVLLKDDVENLGFAGDVAKVAAGYARNFLFPRHLAELATPAALGRAADWRAKAEARRAQIRAEYDLLSQKIAAVALEFVARAGETGKLYGSVTTSQLAEALSEQLGIEADRRKIESEPLRHLGEHQVVYRLGKDHAPVFTVRIVEESADAELIAAIAETITE